MLQLWRSWCEGQGAPCWSRIDWSEHGAILPNVMVYALWGDRYRIRIVGEEIEAYLGHTLAQTYLDDVMPPQNLDDLSMRLDAALASGQPNFALKSMSWRNGFEFVR